MKGREKNIVYISRSKVRKTWDDFDQKSARIEIQGLDVYPIPQFINLWYYSGRNK